MINQVPGLGINYDELEKIDNLVDKLDGKYSIDELLEKLDQLDDLEKLIATETAPIENAGEEVITAEEGRAAGLVTNESVVMQNRPIETNPVLMGQTAIDPKNEFFGGCIDINSTSTGMNFNSAIPPIDNASLFNNCINNEEEVEVNMNIGEDKPAELEPVTRPTPIDHEPVFADKSMYEAFTDTLTALSSQGYTFINEPADRGMTLITPVFNGKEIPEKKFFVDKEGKFYNNIPKVIVGDIFINIEKPNEMASLILFILNNEPVVGTKLTYAAVIAGEGATDAQLKYLKFFKDKDEVKEILKEAYKVDQSARFKVKSWKDNKNFTLISDSSVLGFNNEKVDRPTQTITVKSGKIKLTSQTK